MEFKEKVVKIQTELKAPKNMRNTFGNYNYRNAEGILEAVKPYLKENNVCLTINDDIVAVGERVYVKATVILFDVETDAKIVVSAFARESLTKKGMDESQITGAASSYARKYALNGLFLLDDTKDADTDEHKVESENKQQTKKPELSVAEIKVARDLFIKNKWNEKRLLKGKTIEQLTSKEYGEVMRKIAEKEGK